MDINSLRQEFEKYFSGDPRIFRAPGRVNLIGEHIDYNEGFVMPAAIGFDTWVAISARQDLAINIRSLNLGQMVSVDVKDPLTNRHDWSDYPVGVLDQIRRAGFKVRGADILIAGEVPMGAGLSSSAAIEVATGLALLTANGQSVDRTQLALACQRAENEFVGMRCGIMDQFISCHGRRDHALMLDCRSLQFRLLPLSSKAKMVICNTMVKHEHASGEYNHRRAACEEGVRILRESLPAVRSLRDVSLENLDRFQERLPAIIYRRCLHVVTENDRVQRAAVTLEQNDVAGFGELMAQSHASLRDNYEVSCRELDMMVELAEKRNGVFGARMTGGGFGGCTINLVAANDAETFKTEVAAAYERETGLKPEIYISSAADGASQAA